MAHVETRPVTWPALAVHGGAGTYERASDPGVAAALGAALDRAVDAGWGHLADGDAVAAVVAAVAHLEHDGSFNAGRGSVPTTAGTVEMDGAVMDDTGRAAGVACVTRVSAVRAAATLHRRGGPVLLVGAGADAWAAELDVPLLAPPWGRNRDGSADPSPLCGAGPPSDQGTVGAVAVTADGRLAAASSTGGRAGQPPGRVGDTPIAGAGLWADRAAAVAATGAGEAFILAGFSRFVADRVAGGDGFDAALRAGLARVAGHGGHGGAVTLGGDGTYAAGFSTAAMARAVRHGEGRWTVVV